MKKKMLTKRIEWDQRLEDMARNGFYASTISPRVGLSNTQIYYRLHKMGIRLTDYRRGVGAPAMRVLRHYRVLRTRKAV